MSRAPAVAGLKTSDASHRICHEFPHPAAVPSQNCVSGSRHERRRVREARADDAEVIADYHDRCFRVTYASQLLSGEFEAPDPAGVRQQFIDWFQPGSDFDTWVATANDRPAAHVTAHRHRARHQLPRTRPDQAAPLIWRPRLTKKSRRVVRSGPGTH